MSIVSLKVKCQECGTKDDIEYDDDDVYDEMETEWVMSHDMCLRCFNYLKFLLKTGCN